MLQRNISAWAKWTKTGETGEFVHSGMTGETGEKPYRVSPAFSPAKKNVRHILCCKCERGVK